MSDKVGDSDAPKKVTFKNRNTKKIKKKTTKQLSIETPTARYNTRSAVDLKGNISEFCNALAITSILKKPTQSPLHDACISKPTNILCTCLIDGIDHCRSKVHDLFTGACAPPNKVKVAKRLQEVQGFQSKMILEPISWFYMLLIFSLNIMIWKVFRIMCMIKTSMVKYNK